MLEIYLTFYSMLIATMLDFLIQALHQLSSLFAPVKNQNPKTGIKLQLPDNNWKWHTNPLSDHVRASHYFCSFQLLLSLPRKLLI